MLLCATVMRSFVLFFLILHLNSTAFGQTTPSKEQVDQAEATALAQLNIVDAEVENSGDSDNDFAVALIPPAIHLTTEFIVLAAAAGYISYSLSENLQQTLSLLDVTGPIKETLAALRMVFTTAQDAKKKGVSNQEKLKAHGYSDADIEELASHVEAKSQACSNKENNNSPENFCGNFLQNFAREKFRIEKARGGYLVTRRGKFQCCLEWDDLHCGFEIFNKRGAHLGEVGCLEDEFDPCEKNLNRGSHARPQKDHRPRSQTCSN